MDSLDDVENRCHRNNIRIRGLPDYIEPPQLEPRTSFPVILREFSNFRHLSNFKVNLHKSEAMNIPVPPGEVALLADQFKWRLTSIQYLGAHIAADVSYLYHLKYVPLLVRVTKELSGRTAVTEEEEPPRKKRRYWVHPLVSQRYEKGHFQALYTDLRTHPEKFASFTRMSVEAFDKLLEQLRSGLSFQNTNMRKSISPEERLLITLRFLATGNSFASLHFEFLLGQSTISGIIRRTCYLLWVRLRRSVMSPPSTEEWQNIAAGFETSAQFPNCIGALDGKHIRIKNPPGSGSRYFNYKQYCSVVLLAVADSDDRFVLVDIGAYGSTADARFFRTSRIFQQLLSKQLALPGPRLLPGSSGPTAPFVIVADEAFGLSTHVLRPFPRRGLDTRRRVFNYRLTRARRFVECAFGILTSKWRVFLGTIQMEPESACSLVKAAVVLHNFCRINDAGWTFADDQMPTTSQVADIDENQANRQASSGIQVRDSFADYFLTPQGEVPWQLASIHEG
ncbi:uncharacterized protein [Eleutherodactylus coqui]|uniref:uncharacterized protein n=1 Tax=Eleutherodactylus coqui TaxID=57060 RepID=UPI00346334BE